MYNPVYNILDMNWSTCIYDNNCQHLHCNNMNKAIYMKNVLKLETYDTRDWQLFYSNFIYWNIIQICCYFFKILFHFTDKFLLITKDFFTIWDFFSKNSKEVWTGYLISFEITIIRTTKVKTMKKKWLQAIENSAVSNKVICKLVILIKNCKFCS